MRASLACFSFLLVACGGKTSSIGDVAATDPGFARVPAQSTDPAAPSEGTPRARMIVATNGGEAGACLPPFAVGRFSDGTLPDHPVDSGDMDRGAAVTLGCIVAPSPTGSGYTVHAHAAANDGRGVFTLHAPSVDDAGDAPQSAQIRVLWGDEGDAVVWREGARCMLDARAASPLAGIAQGRYWASFRCTGFETAAHEPCTLSGTFRIENCRTTTP